MVSPYQGPRYSSASMSNIAGANARRSNLKISDPMPGTFRCTVSTPFAQNELHQNASAAQLYAPQWLADGARTDGRCLSTGPSIIMSTAPSRGSLVQTPRKSGRFRATIKRIFGNKQKRTSIADHCKEFYISVCDRILVLSPQPSSGSLL